MTVEINNGSSIPTYNLLNTLEEIHPFCDFYFVMGSDLLPSLKLWQKGEQMFENFKFILIPRDGSDDIDSADY